MNNKITDKKIDEIITESINRVNVLMTDEERTTLKEILIEAIDLLMEYLNE